MQHTEQKNGDISPISIFLYALKAKETKRQYPRRLKVFFDFIGLDGSLELQASQFVNKALQDTHWTYLSFMQFITFQRERAARGEISESTISNYYKAAKLFCEMNDIVLNWKKITRGLPTGRHAANDRAPQLSELKRIVEYPDRRIKPIVYLLISSGIRIGAFDYLKWKHITSISNDKGEIVAAKLIVYADEPDQYEALMTPESYFAIKKWIEYRAISGEDVSGESFIARDIWRTTDSTYGAHYGLAKYPKQLKSSGVKSLLERAIRAQGIFKPLPPGKKRREWQAAHGMRKYANTAMIKAGVSTVVKEMLLGHRCGLENNYYRPSFEADMVPEYLKAIDLLTIEEENRLNRRVKELQDKSDEVSYIKFKHRQEIDALREDINRKLEKVMSIIQLNPILANAKPEVLAKFEIQD